jgi:DNA primase large subunit
MMMADTDDHLSLGWEGLVDGSINQEAAGLLPPCMRHLLNPLVRCLNAAVQTFTLLTLFLIQLLVVGLLPDLCHL